MFLFRSAETTGSASTAPTPVPATSECPSAKVIIVGESSVGKSCVAWRFCGGDFQGSLEATVGASFMWRVSEIPPEGAPASPSPASNPSAAVPTSVPRRLKYEIWDTAGQERYRSLVPVYYRGAAAALIMYDLTDRNSFERAKVWVQELRRCVHSDDVHLILVGNKADLAPQHRQVSSEEGETAARQLGLEGFFETSAKDNINVDEAFQFVGGLVLQTLSRQGGETGRGNAGTVPLAEGNTPSSWSCGCT